MKQDVFSLLGTLGIYTPDEVLIDLLVCSVTEQILNETNQASLPEGLKNLATERVVGQYLARMKGAGRLEGFDLDGAVKSIQEGDTSVSFDAVSPEKRLDQLIAHLTTSRSDEILRYRRLVW